MALEATLPYELSQSFTICKTWRQNATPDQIRMATNINVGFPVRRIKARVSMERTYVTDAAIGGEQVTQATLISASLPRTLVMDGIGVPLCTFRAGTTFLNDVGRDARVMFAADDVEHVTEYVTPLRIQAPELSVSVPVVPTVAAGTSSTVAGPPTGWTVDTVPAVGAEGGTVNWTVSVTVQLSFYGPKNLPMYM